MSETRGIRWWPAVGIALAALAALAWLWLDADRDGQRRTLNSLMVIVGAVMALAIWLLAFSRARARVRAATAAAIVLLIGFAATTLRIKGVTGDLMPVVEWRWSSRTPQPIARGEHVSPSPAAQTPSPAPGVPPSAVPTMPQTAEPPAVAPEPARVTAPEGAAIAKPLPAYPQFLGPDRNGAVKNVRLGIDWKATPPRQLWRRQVGAGWSGFAVANGLAVTHEQRGEEETVVAYDAATGNPRWSHGERAHYESTVAGEGPRATPTISRGRVFALGSTGILVCLDLETGRFLWRRDIGADTGSPVPEWGRSSSPLVVDDLVIVSAGGSSGRSLVAYRFDTGEPAWRGGDDLASYSSPILATLAGTRQIVVLNHASVAAHHPATGAVLWRHPWPREAPSVAAPIVLSDSRVLLSSGYGIGSRVLEIERDGEALTQKLVWESTRLKAKFTNLVVHDGFVYGLDDGVLVSLDPATGERRWKSGRYGHGQVILVGRHLLVQTEDGEIVLVDASPEAHHERARLTAFNHKTWNPPALAGRYLFVRTDGEAVCYELPEEKS